MATKKVKWFQKDGSLLHPETEVSQIVDIANKYVKKSGDTMTGGLTSTGFTVSGSAVGQSTQYNLGGIVVRGSSLYRLDFPNKSGTIATTADVSGGGSKLDAYPVGSIYLCWYYASSTSDTYHPAKLFGGSWTAIPSGYALWTYRSSLSSTDSAHEVSAGLPNITGTIGARRSSGDETILSDASGAFYNDRKSSDSDLTWEPNRSTHYGHTLIDFSASKSSTIYGNSTTVQPPAYRIFAWRRTA